MNVKIREKIKGKEMTVFVYASAFLLYVAAFLLTTPAEIEISDTRVELKLYKKFKEGF